MVPIYLERWIVAGVSCPGCEYLGSVGPFRLGVGPYPPLHDHCNCYRAAVVSRGMSLDTFQALVRQADRNGDRAYAIEERARTLMSRG